MAGNHKGRCKVGCNLGQGHHNHSHIRRWHCNSLMNKEAATILVEVFLEAQKPSSSPEKHSVLVKVLVLVKE